MVYLSAVGDVYLNRSPPESAFYEVLNSFKERHLIFCNLEAPLTVKTSPLLERLSPLRSSPDMIDGLIYAGFNIVSLANNHTMDYGSDALIETINCLESKKILYVGGGRDLKSALQPCIVKVGNSTIAFLAFESTIWSFGAEAKEWRPGISKINISALLPEPHVNKPDLQILKKSIRDAKEAADVVVLSMHWGVELSETLAVHQTALGHSAVDAGADLIIGHHPHILQGVEVYRKGIICHSLGNFVFDTDDPFPKETVILQVTLTKDGVEEAYLTPCFINIQGQPAPVSYGSEKYNKTFKNLRGLSKDLKTELFTDEKGIIIKL